MSERILDELPDWSRELRQPAPVPKMGDRLTQFGREFVVIEVYDRGDVMVVTLLHASKDGDSRVVTDLRE